MLICLSVRTLYFANAWNYRLNSNHLLSSTVPLSCKKLKFVRTFLQYKIKIYGCLCRKTYYSTLKTIKIFRILYVYRNYENWLVMSSYNASTKKNLINIQKPIIISSKKLVKLIYELLFIIYIYKFIWSPRWARPTRTCSFFIIETN